jgi:DNA-binding NtrC family response regulator
MTRYAWPGNVRELRNAVERAVVLGDRDHIIAADLPPQVLAGGASPRIRTSPPTPPLGSNSVALPAVIIDPLPPAALAPPTPAAASRPPPARSLRDLEKQGILAALAATGGNKAQAAAILEIDRSTLYKKLKDYDIES